MVSLCLPLCLSGPAAPFLLAHAAEPQASPAAPGSADSSTLRLVAESGPTGGRYSAGIDILMLPGSHTYWQIPGEAGVPPVFTFNGSENVRSAEVKYPVPQRLTEGGIEAYGYENRVVFPVEVTPDDPSKPAVLHADVRYAVCNTLCLPGHGEATITLRPGAPGTAPELVRQSLAAVPRPVPDLPALTIAPQPGAAEPKDAVQQSWVLRWGGPTPPRDIFPVAPEGAVFATAKIAPDAWTLTALSAVTSAASRGVPVTLVVAAEGGPVEVTHRFALKPPAAP